jgi:antitoxin HicB
MNPIYPFEIRPLTLAEGGGYLIQFPDLQGCISDGQTPEEALKNGQEALQGWLETRQEQGLPIPLPNSAALEPVKLVARLPRSLHNNLTIQAKREGVSLNTLLVMLLSQNQSRASSL